MLNIEKRTGEIVSFDKSKIINAIHKAFLDVDDTEDTTNIAEEIADAIEITMYGYPAKLFTVEDIQNLVEDHLMQSDRRDVARAYTRFRYKKEIAREGLSDLIDAVREKLDATNVQNQNANVDEHSFGGRTGEASGVVTKRLALDYIISKKTRENHLNNEVYIHDLDNYYVGSHNCLSIPFDDLLANGFKTRQTDVRPAGSVNTAFQLVAVIFQLQSLQQFGGVSATHLDWTMVPYVRKSFAKHYLDALDLEIERVYGAQPEATSLDDLSNELKEKINEIVDVEYTILKSKEKNDIINISIFDEKIYPKKFKRALHKAIENLEKEIHQAVEGMYHNLNTLQSRSGNQLPFTSINYGTCTLPEGRMVTKALLEVSLEGLGTLHRTSIFPCGIFQCMKGVNRKPGDPNYDLFQLALQSTAKRLYPNYANVDWSGNEGYDPDDPTTYFSTMGKCKL